VRRLAVAALLLALSGCQIESTLKKKPAYLELHVVPDTARVTIDDESVGSARSIAVNPHPLSPGEHFIEIEAKGYFPHDLMLDLPSGLTKVEVKLRAVPE
jgi:hypothetical protein